MTFHELAEDILKHAGKLLTGNEIWKLAVDQGLDEKLYSLGKAHWATGKMAHWKYGRNFRNFLLKNLPKKILENKMKEMYQIEKAQ